MSDLSGRPASVLRLEVPEADVDIASDRLWACGASAVSEEPAEAGRVRLTADVATAAGLVLEPGWSVAAVEVDDDAHLDRWREWAVTVRAGERVLIHPAWLPDPVSRPGDVVVRIEPGRSFGSGSHPSTRLVVAALEEHLVGGEAVLDVGSGSGVLAVAAALLGAASAHGVDIDPAAVSVGQHNARRNGVADRVTFAATPVGEVPGAFDVVVANIGLGVLVDLAEAIGARVRSGGVLVLAGLLDHQVDEAVAAYAGFEPVGSASEGGWSAVVLRHSLTATTSESATGR